MKEAADLKEKLRRCEAELENARKANELSLLPMASFPTDLNMKELYALLPCFLSIRMHICFVFLYRYSGFIFVSYSHVFPVDLMGNCMFGCSCWLSAIP